MLRYTLSPQNIYFVINHCLDYLNKPLTMRLRLAIMKGINHTKLRNKLYIR